MRSLLVSLVAAFTIGCGGFYIEEPPRHHYKAAPVYDYEYQYCDDSEPYWESAEEYHVYYDHYGYYEGECGYWYFGHGEWEEWCYWEDQCGWDFVTAWHDW